MNKVMEELHSERVAFFRMKLGTPNILVTHRGGEGDSVARGHKSIIAVLTHHMVGVNEVKSWSLWHIFEQWI